MGEEDVLSGALGVTKAYDGVVEWGWVVEDGVGSVWSGLAESKWGSGGGGW